MKDSETVTGFDQFELCRETLEAIAAMGYTEPTAVQTQSIPRVLANKDLVVQSRTGTGKTAAFGIPIIERTDLNVPEPQALVLCPTRELALQVNTELAALGAVRGVRSAAIYGGASMHTQLQELRAGAHVVVGTPGRVLDHLRRGALNFRRLHHLVLDEADEMLSRGFYEEVSAILDQLPRERQTLLFSATLPTGVEGLIYHHQSDPERISLSSDTLLVHAIDHAYYVTPSMEKTRTLARLLETQELQSAIVFCNTREETRMVTAYLKRVGVAAEMISGELNQKERERVMNAIKEGNINIMVATDVAARGIDIDDLSHVINFSVPESVDTYVHRTGRTGRIGKKGTALTLVGLRELPRLSAIEGIKGIHLEERKLPTLEDECVNSVVHAVRDIGAKAETAPEALLKLRMLANPDSQMSAYKRAAAVLLEGGLEPGTLARLIKRALEPTVKEIPAAAQRPSRHAQASEPQAAQPQPQRESRPRPEPRSRPEPRPQPRPEPRPERRPEPTPAPVASIGQVVTDTDADEQPAAEAEPKRKRRRRRRRKPRPAEPSAESSSSAEAASPAAPKDASASNDAAPAEPQAAGEGEVALPNPDQATDTP